LLDWISCPTFGSKLIYEKAGADQKTGRDGIPDRAMARKWKVNYSPFLGPLFDFS